MGLPQRPVVVVIEPGQKSPSWEICRNRVVFWCSKAAKESSLKASSGERITYARSRATRKNPSLLHLHVAHPKQSLKSRERCVRIDSLLASVVRKARPPARQSREEIMQPPENEQLNKEVRTAIDVVLAEDGHES